SKRDGLLYTALVLQNIGLVLFLVDGYFNPVSERMLIYGGIVALGTLAWLLYLADAYRHRLRRKVELLMADAAISFACLLAGVAFAALVYFFAGSRGVELDGTFRFLGWRTAIILGKPGTAGPFVVWSRHYRHLIGSVRGRVPAQLYRVRVAVYQGD